MFFQFFCKKHKQPSVRGEKALLILTSNPPYKDLLHQCHFLVAKSSPCSVSQAISRLSRVESELRFRQENKVRLPEPNSRWSLGTAIHFSWVYEGHWEPLDSFTRYFGKTWDTFERQSIVTFWQYLSYKPWARQTNWVKKTFRWTA